MIRAVHRVVASLLMMVFVNFMFSNVIFTHIHKGLDGRTVAHSHPYLPSTGHSHSAGAYDLIAGFNLSATTAEASQCVNVAQPAIAVTEVYAAVRSHVVCGHVDAGMLRGPPSLI